MEHLLLPTQRNDVLKALQDAGLNPGDFKWVKGVYYTKSQEVLTRGNRITNNCPKLRFRDSYYFFQFEFPDSQHYYTCSPGSDSFGEKGNPGRWLYQVEAVRNWADRLKEEIDAPNLWEEMVKCQLVISPAIPDNVVDEAISWSDAEAIAEKLELLGDEIKKVYGLTSEQDRFVRTKLNYLAEGAKRFGRKDWMLLSISIFQVVAWGLSLTPEQREQLGALIKTFLGGYIYLIGG